LAINSISVVVGHCSTCCPPLGDTYESVVHTGLHAYSMCQPEPMKTYHIRNKAQVYFQLDFPYPI